MRVVTGGLPNHSLFALPDREARVGVRWRSDADAVNDLRSNASREADGADALTLDRSCFSFPWQREAACEGERWQSAERVREK